MVKFECQSCGRTMSVPDQYAGKRVRCPGCQMAQRVPVAEPSLDGDDDLLPTQPLADLSGLQDSMESGVRRLRQILIGCGECRKTIKVPEAKLGKTVACSFCGTVLKVDAFNLSKAKGDLIDMTHLELEKADLLSDSGSHGSTLGGSSIQLDGSTGTGRYQLNMPPTGSMSGVSTNNSKTQMRELRELNDLKYSGQITNEEYRERKKEIYAGKTLAIQAMSRAADGTGGRPVIKQEDKPGLLPKPLIALVVASIIGGTGYAAYMAISGSSSSTPEVTKAPPPTAPAATEPPPEDVAVVAEAPVETPEVEAPVEEEVVEPPPEQAVEQVVEADPTDMLPVTIFEIDESLGSNGDGLGAGSGQPAVTMVIKDWQTGWPAYFDSSESDRAINKACDVLQRISVRDDRATIGVAVGPPADGLGTPEYLDFRQDMHDILTQTARSNGVYDDLIIRTSDRAANMGRLESHRLHVTSKSNRNVRAAILTGIQDGFCVSYWFAGSKTLYDEFLDTVGRAELGPQ